MSESREPPKFLADGMLGSLARKLRILGFDTLYEAKLEDKVLREFARKTGRILLTSDLELFKSAKRSNTLSILIDSSGDRAQLFEVLENSSAIKIQPDHLVSRCSLCNGDLYDVGRKNYSGTIHSCRDCGKTYWRGSHWKKLLELFNDVNQLLEEQRLLIV
jgi:uncharacterized protein with PIN domain